MWKAFVINCLFFLFPLYCFVQQPLGFSFTHYNLNNGLAAYDATALAQDDDGFIWIGTINGLQRFDGSRFITFKQASGNPHSLTDNYITHLHFDKRKRLWVMLANGQVGIFDTKRFRFNPVDIVVDDPRLVLNERSMFEDSKGNLFIIYPRRLYFTFNEKSREFSILQNPFRLPPNWNILNMTEDVINGNYYAGTDSGLVIYNAHTKKTSSRLNNVGEYAIIDQLGHLGQTNPMLIDKQHRLWFLRWPPGQGYPLMYCYDLVRKKLVLNQYLLMDAAATYHEIKKLVQQKDSTIWVTGLWIFARYNDDKPSFTPVYNGYLNDHSINYQRITDMMEDREHNLWIATNNNGIYIFNPRQQLFSSITHINRHSKKSGDGNVLAFTSLASGQILTGAWGDGLFLYDSNFNNLPISTIELEQHANRTTWSIHRDARTGNIWMGMQPGVLLYNEKTLTSQYANPAIFNNNTVRQVLNDSIGNAWFGTQRMGLYKWVAKKGSQNFESGFEKFRSIPDCRVQKLYLDWQGYVWVCTINEGIYKIDPVNDRIVDHITDKGPLSKRIPMNDAQTIMQYNDSIMMIAAGGLKMYNTISNVITPIEGGGLFSLERIMSMEKDDAGNLWISMINGLCRMGIDRKSLVYFDRNDGMLTDIFNSNASYRLPDGRMLFGTSADFIVFDPSRVAARTRPPKALVTDFKVNNRSLLVDSLVRLKKVELSPMQNSIVIEFSALSYLVDYPILYQLEGIDENWQKAGELKQAVYNYLPPGDYVFRVKSANEEGLTSDEVSELHLRVKAPFWKTWWFLGLLIFATLGVVYWLDKQRMQKLRATESIRTRIATSLTEDLTHSLSSININSELAKTKVDTNKERTREYIAQISETSNRMVQAMYDMVWSINPRNDTMKDTLERMKNFAVEMEGLYPVDIIFDIDESAARIELDMEYRYELLSIFKEAVWNAIKHAHARHIQASIRIRKGRFFMFIEDDGKGFDTSAAILARGISDMRRRAAGINAQFYIESSINTGTVVKIEMKV